MSMSAKFSRKRLHPTFEHCFFFFFHLNFIFYVYIVERGGPQVRVGMVRHGGAKTNVSILFFCVHRGGGGESYFLLSNCIITHW